MLTIVLYGCWLKGMQKDKPHCCGLFEGTQMVSTFGQSNTSTKNQVSKSFSIGVLHLLTERIWCCRIIYQCQLGRREIPTQPRARYVQVGSFKCLQNKILHFFSKLNSQLIQPSRKLFIFELLIGDFGQSKRSIPSGVRVLERFKRYGGVTLTHSIPFYRSS